MAQLNYDEQILIVSDITMPTHDKHMRQLDCSFVEIFPGPQTAYFIRFQIIFCSTLRLSPSDFWCDLI